MSLLWPGTVPAPTTSGDTNTYPGILPGVDLKLRALRTGFEDSWVIRDAASGLAQQSLQLPLTLTNATVNRQGDGSWALIGADGTRAGTIAAPVVYDARRDAWGDPVAAKQLPMTVTRTTAGVTLTITGFADYLSDPATVFPVTIDPATTTLSPTFDTYVQSNVTTDLSTTGTLHVGNFSSYPSRTYMSWGASAFAGTTIQSARLDLYQAGAQTCSARGWQLWDAGGANTSTRWTKQPSVYSQYASASSSKGYSGCAGGTVSVDATSWLRHAVAAGAGTASMMLRATDESDQSAAKVFASSENSQPPALVVTYNRPPGTPSAPTVKPSSFYNGTAYTSKTFPQFMTRGTDPDIDSLTYDVEVYRSSTASGSPVATCSTPTAVSGQLVGCTANAAVADNTAYWARSRATDGNGGTSGWSALVDGPFRVSTTTPPAPSVSCSGYPDQSTT